MNPQGQENIHSNVPMNRAEVIHEYERFELTQLSANADKALERALQELEKATRASEEARRRLRPMSHTEYKEMIARVERTHLLDNMPHLPTRSRSKSLPSRSPSPQN